MSKKPKPLHDGAKIYDTPKYIAGSSDGAAPYHRGLLYAGYDGGYGNAVSVSVNGSSPYTAYWERQLFREIRGLIPISVPLEWDYDYFLFALYRCGFVAILKDAQITDSTGKIIGRQTIPQHGNIAGRGLYYQPTRITVANPLIKSKSWIIGKDCAVIKLNPDFSGAWDLIHHYADEMGIITQSLRMAIVNSRFAKGFAANGKAGAESLRTMLDAIDNGCPAVCLRQDAFPTGQDGKPVLPWVELDNRAGENYIIDKLLRDLEAEYNAFRRAVGIPVLSDKKERLIQAETDVINAAAGCALETWCDTLLRSLEVAKRIIPGLDITIQRPDWMTPTEGGTADGA